MEVIHITQKDFEQQVLQSREPVLVDFFATWCNPCRMIAPVLEEIAGEREDIKVCKIDVDQEPALAARYGVVSIPTLLVIRDGQVAARVVGLQTKEKLLALFD